MVQNTYPKLHNAAWPGVVGKGSPDAEPFIDLDTMLDLTAQGRGQRRQVRRRRPLPVRAARRHRLQRRRSEDARRQGARRRPGDRLGRRAGLAADRRRLGDGRRSRAQPTSRRRSARAAASPSGCASWASGPTASCASTRPRSPGDWLKDPEGNQKRIAETFRQACDIAADHGERLAAEGEICWGGMHSWKRMVQLLELTDRPGMLGFQADMAHTLLYTLGYNAPEDRILPENWNWSDPAKLDKALATLTAALRPWTIDFHVAQNDATVKGSGSHDKTGRHCLPDDPNGKLKIAHHAGFWMRDSYGNPTKKFKHICWDGCMFPNEMMMKPQTWNEHPRRHDRRARCARVELMPLRYSPRPRRKAAGFASDLHIMTP